MTENYALLGGSIKIDPTDFDASGDGATSDGRKAAPLIARIAFGLVSIRRLSEHFVAGLTVGPHQSRNRAPWSASHPRLRARTGPNSSPTDQPTDGDSARLDRMYTVVDQNL